MARMGVSTESLEGQKAFEPGFYDFRLDGFKPKKAKSGDSTNFNPDMRVINHATRNDDKIFFNLNSAAGWIQKDFVHCLGLQMEIDGDMAFMPGDWQPDPQEPNNVSKYTYSGPMVGRTGRVEIAVRKDQKGKDQSYVKQLLCQVPGCQEKHSTDLK